MRTRKALTLLLLLAVVAVLAVPSQASACAFLDRLFGGCWGAGRTTYSMPYAAAPAVAPASSCSTCYYMPQTSYRMTYRPVTMVAYQPTLTPYRSYRLVYSPTTAYSPVSSCDPCGSSACVNYGTVVGGATMGSACATCAPVTASMPAASSSSGAAPQTFESQKPTQRETRKEEANQNGDEPDLQPIPDGNTRYDTSAPELIGPETRSTQRWVRQAAYRGGESAAQSAPVVDVQWRAASR